MYNENGEIELITEYQIHTEYHPNGNIKANGSIYYNSNLDKWVKDGLWIYFDPDGKEWVDKKTFEDGIEIEQN